MTAGPRARISDQELGQACVWDRVRGVWAMVPASSCCVSELGSHAGSFCRLSTLPNCPGPACFKENGDVWLPFGFFEFLSLYLLGQRWSGLYLQSRWSPLECVCECVCV